MNQKFIKLIIVGLLITASAFIALFIFFPNTVGNTLEKIGFFDSLFGDANFRTSAEHQKIYGIETAKISSEEREKLNGIVKESIKAQLEYYSTKNDGSLEKVKNLYLPEEFDKYKEYVKREAGLHDAESGNQTYDKIEIKKFSPPRTYKVLPDRIGIMSFLRFSDKQTNTILQIFILKNNNDDWKIEKREEVLVQTEGVEAGLIKQILNQPK